MRLAPWHVTCWHVPGNAAKEVDSKRQAPMDPFQALKYAETMADRIAQSMAPRWTHRPGEVCKSFCFGGHQSIFREINLLHGAHEFVKKSPDVCT